MAGVLNVWKQAQTHNVFISLLLVLRTLLKICISLIQLIYVVSNCKDMQYCFVHPTEQFSNYCFVWLIQQLTVWHIQKLAITPGSLYTKVFQAKKAGHILQSFITEN